MPMIALLPDNRILQAETGQTLHALLAREGLIDAPCGGSGTCGKCRVTVDGKEILACQQLIDRDLTVTLSTCAPRKRGATEGKRAAFDIGTTTVVCYLLDEAGHEIARASAPNPQRGFGADVISRIRAAQNGQAEAMTALIRQTMQQLLFRICSNPEELEVISVVGNPAMQQLFLGLSMENLAQIPYAPVLKKAERTGKLLTVPDISGFVGADTVAGILACGIHETEKMTLLVDIGTNGELVLGNRHRRLACSTAAGPALEGANIQFGMRAEDGAIDHVWLDASDMTLRCHVLGDAPARGICGSGLMDALAAALDLGLLNHRGRIQNEERKIQITHAVYLTQEDIRQVQMAKGAIRAGIELMTRKMGISLADIEQVILAGAFGSFLRPGSACRIGLLPGELEHKITVGGNTAGLGAMLLAADPEKLAIADEIAANTEFLELADLPDFPKAFARAMELPMDWCASARAFGFTHAAAFDPGILQAREDVRAMCAENKCRAYGKNWTCPPHCGTVRECEEKMQHYRFGLLVQTVGHLCKDIDTKAYRKTEQRHLAQFEKLCDTIRRHHPDALCLGTGGCRLCKSCAWPEPCRFPERAVSSMEGYGLFVTQVCRDAGLAYHHGDKTITYTACILYG